jgi:hypothetical protein
MPHRCEHIVRKNDPEERAAEFGVNSLHSRCVFAAALAEGEIAKRGELEHAALCVDVAVDAAGAADHMLGPEAGVEEVELTHAIQEWKDRGLRSDAGREIVDRLLEGVGLGSEDDEIEDLRLRAELVSSEEPRPDRRVAQWADDLKAVAAKRLSARGADEERNVAADLSKTAAVKSAGCAGTDNKDAHVSMVAERKSRFPAGMTKEGRERQAVA